MIEDELSCPYCNWGGEYCDFPDLFYQNADNTIGLNKQYKLLQELWSVGYNIVTCGCCGNPFIIKIDKEIQNENRK